MTLEPVVPLLEVALVAVIPLVAMISMVAIVTLVAVITMFTGFTLRKPALLIAIAELVDANENRRRVVEIGGIALERFGRSLSGH